MVANPNKFRASSAKDTLHRFTTFFHAVNLCQNRLFQLQFDRCSCKQGIKRLPCASLSGMFQELHTADNALLLRKEPTETRKPTIARASGSTQFQKSVAFSRFFIIATQTIFRKLNILIENKHSFMRFLARIPRALRIAAICTQLFASPVKIGLWRHFLKNFANIRLAHTKIPSLHLLCDLIVVKELKDNQP